MRGTHLRGNEVRTCEGLGGTPRYLKIAQANLVGELYVVGIVLYCRAVSCGYA